MRTKTLLSTAALVFVLAVTPAFAESRPHKMSGTGHFTSATEFASDGIATHLGHFSETGSVQFSGTGDPFVLQVDGWAIHTAANGDQVYELISGQLNVVTGAGTATATYVGGTGRFADVSGSSTISLQLTGPGTYEFSGDGTIDY